MLKIHARIALLAALMMTTCAGFATSTPVAISGQVKNSQLTVQPSARLVWSVMNCATVPQVDGSTIASPFLVTADGSGAISGTIHGSPDISCGTTAYYQVTAYTNAGVQLWTRNYVTSGTTFNLNTAPQLGSLPAPPSSGTGTPGAAGTINIGTTTTLAAGQPATVANLGTSTAALLNFGIPAGPAGPTGPAGANGTNGTNGAPGAAGAGFPGAAQFTSVLGNATQLSASLGSFTANNLRATDASGNEIDSLIPSAMVARTDTSNLFTKTQQFVNMDDFAVAGPELLTSTGWVLGGNWTGTYSSGFTSTVGNSGSLSYPVTTVAGFYYILTVTIVNTNPVPSSNLSPLLGGSIASPGLTGNGTPTTVHIGFSAQNTTSGFVIPANLFFAGTLSNLSLKSYTVRRAALLSDLDTARALAYETRYGNAGSGNIFMGHNSGQFASGQATSDTALGDNALAGEFVGGKNTAIGYRALRSSWGSGDDVAIGANSLVSQTLTFGNTAVGSQSMASCITCSESTAVGMNAGGGITYGSANTLIGMNAGDKITTGGSNIVIGTYGNDTVNNVDTPTPDTSNYMNIGNGLSAWGINYGIFGGVFGVGKQLASYSLDVNGNIRTTGLTDFTSGPTVTPSVTGSTTYTYSVQAFLRDGTHASPSSVTTITNGPDSLSLTSYNTISWAYVPNAAYYMVYATAPSVYAVSSGPGPKLVGTSINDNGGHAAGSAASGNNSDGLIIGTSQSLNSVQGIGQTIATTTGAFISGDPRGTNAAGTEVDLPLANFCLANGSNCPYPQSHVFVAHQFFTAYDASTRSITAAQPLFSDIAGQAVAAQIPNLPESQIAGLVIDLGSLCHTDGSNCFSPFPQPATITPRAGGSSTATCDTGVNCNSRRGTIVVSIADGNGIAGVAGVAWPATSVPQVCMISNSGVYPMGMSTSVTSTGFNIGSSSGMSGQTVFVYYSCQP